MRATNEHGCAEQLARFFRHAAPVSIPVQVTALRGGTAQLREAAVIVYRTPEHALFVSTLPLEFGDAVRLEGSGKRCVASASVVAVHYYEGHKAVAVKFPRVTDNWVTQP